MNAAALGFNGYGALLRGWLARETIQFGLGVLIAIALAASAPWIAGISLLPAFIVAGWWCRIGVRVRWLWADTGLIRLPRQGGLMLRALLMQFAGTVVLPALLLALLGASPGASFACLLLAAAVGMQLITLSLYTASALILALYLGAITWCHAAHMPRMLAATAPWPWELLVAALLAIPAILSCMPRRRSGNGVPEPSNLPTRLAQLGGTLEIMDGCWQARTHETRKPARMARQRLALALGPPMAMPPPYWWATQLLTMAALALFVIVAGPVHNTHIPMPRSPAGILLLLMPVLGGQSVYILQKRHAGSLPMLALLPALGTPGQCRLHVCLGLLRTFALFALGIVLAVIAAGLAARLPAAWLLWAAAWALPMLALNVIACVLALASVAWAWLPIACAGIAGLLGTMALMSPHQGHPWVAYWYAVAVSTALLALAARWQWRRRTHPLLPH